MREDIHGGLKNALERGASLEQAIRSFVNAGYHEQDVREAASALNTSSLSLVKLPSSPSPTQVQQKPAPYRQSPISTPSAFKVKSKKGPNWLIVILSLVLLLSIAAFVLSLLYKEQIAEIIRSLIG